MKTLPKTERLWLTETSRSGEVFYITAKQNDDNCYYIYKRAGDGVERIGKGRSPLDLENKFIK